VSKNILRSHVDQQSVWGWRKTSEEAMLDTHRMMKHAILDEVYLLKKKLEEIRTLEEGISQIGLSVNKVKCNL
jgi:hypothetical protein